MAAETITISCDECALDGTGACEDCVVGYLLRPDRSEAVVIRSEEARAIRLLEQAGLVPALRHERRAG